MECEEIIVDDTESSSIHSPDEYMSSLEYESETDIEAIEGANRDRDRDIATSMPSTSAEPAPHYNTDTDRPYFCELSPTSSGVLKLVLRRSAINCSLRRSVRHKPWMIMSNTSTSTPPTDEIDSNGISQLQLCFPISSFEWFFFSFCRETSAERPAKETNGEFLLLQMQTDFQPT